MERECGAPLAIQNTASTAEGSGVLKQKKKTPVLATLLRDPD